MILGLKINSESLPLFSYFYNITSGTRVCIEGYTDIAPTGNLGVYSTVNRTDWDNGTHIYADEYLTINLPNGYYRSIAGGTIDKFFFQITDGIITEKILPMTGC